MRWLPGKRHASIRRQESERIAVAVQAASAKTVEQLELKIAEAKVKAEKAQAKAAKGAKAHKESELREVEKMQAAQDASTKVDAMQKAAKALRGALEVPGKPGNRSSAEAALGAAPTFEPSGKGERKSKGGRAAGTTAESTASRSSAKAVRRAEEAAAEIAAEAAAFAAGNLYVRRGEIHASEVKELSLGRTSARAIADEVAFKAQRAAESAKQARSERLAVERAVKRRSAEAEANLLKMGAEHAARAALHEAKVAAASEAAARTSVAAKAAEAATQQLEGSVASQRRVLQAEWDAAEAASQAHAVAAERLGCARPGGGLETSRGDARRRGLATCETRRR